MTVHRALAWDPRGINSGWSTPGRRVTDPQPLGWTSFCCRYLWSILVALNVQLISDGLYNGPVLPNPCISGYHVPSYIYYPIPSHTQVILDPRPDIVGRLTAGHARGPGIWIPRMGWPLVSTTRRWCQDTFHDATTMLLNLCHLERLEWMPSHVVGL